jgi:hypothetical protein
MSRMMEGAYRPCKARVVRYEQGGALPAAVGVQNPRLREAARELQDVPQTGVENRSQPFAMYLLFRLAAAL